MIVRDTLELCPICMDTPIDTPSPECLTCAGHGWVTPVAAYRARFTTMRPPPYEPSPR